MATTQHYLWAAGHFFLIIGCLNYLVSCFQFKTIPTWWYKTSYIGAVVSYAIVCQKSLGIPQPTAAYVKRAMMDENVQYLLLAIFWWTSKPVGLTLVPYAIFSLFHALTFIRTTVMPQFLPPTPPATAGGQPTPHRFAKKLQVWVKNNYDSAMKAVAYTELIILVRVVFGALLLQNSLLSPIIYAHFLRQRYYQSQFSRDALAHALARADGLVNNLHNPTVTGVWDKVKMLVARWGGSNIAPAPAPARR
ncbi:hypothetical protein C8J56DRAFT_852025 [Mycena floridula]|nr:hypothetical protein C8J56DRAFT_852025 [Mycena floridula]